MSRSIRFLLIFSLFSLPAVVMGAENLGYTWIEADYSNLDVDTYDDDEDFIEDFDDGDGWAVRGSVAFHPNFFAFSSYSQTDSDVTFFDDDNFLITESTDVERWDVGIGFNFTLGNFEEMQTDLVARAGYSDIDFGDFAFGGSSDDDSFDDLDEDSSDGWFADASLRSQLTSWLEGSIGVRYTDIETADNFSVIGNALFEITPSLGINVAADVGDEVSSYMIGARYTFDYF